MVELDFCLFSADVLGPALSSYLSADRLEVRNEVTSSWSGEVRIFPLDVVVQNDHVAVVGTQGR